MGSKTHAEIAADAAGAPVSEADLEGIEYASDDVVAEVAEVEAQRWAKLLERLAQ